MITTDEIRAMLLDVENDRVERTISTTNTDKFGQAICAFANDLPNHKQPGYLFLGEVSQGQVIDILIIGAFFNSYSLQYYSFWKGKIGIARTVPVSWTTPMSIASVTVDSFHKSFLRYSYSITVYESKSQGARIFYCHVNLLKS